MQVAIKLALGTLGLGGRDEVDRVGQGYGKTERADAERGDCVLFNADVVHAGAAYDKPNTRLFCYLDAEDAPRKPNQVWFPDLTRLKLASRPKRQCKKRDMFTIGFEPASAYKTWSYLQSFCVIDGFKIEELCSK